MLYLAADLDGVPVREWAAYHRNATPALRVRLSAS